MDNHRTGYPKRKHPRLGSDLYARPGMICSITIGTRDRRLIFARPEIASAAVETLRTLATKTGVPVYGYCIMPDHVHLVIEPSAACNIIAFVGQFKNLTQRAIWNQGVQGSFWQTSFWDHFLRDEKEVVPVVMYVLNNPVRRGLVANWSDYPFAGSLVLELPPRV